MENQNPTISQPIPQQNIPAEQTPPTPPPFTPHNSLRWLKLLIIGVVVLLVISIVGVSSYLLGTNKNTPAEVATQITPTLTPTTDPTASWKTFSDTKLNFEFKYPPEYSITKNVDETTNLNHNITWSQKPTIDTCRGDGCRYSTSSQVIKLGNNSFNKVAGLIGQVGGNIPESYIDYEITSLDPSQKIVFRIKELPFDKSYQELLKQYTGNRTVQEIPSNQVAMLNQILSTFKFTQSALEGHPDVCVDGFDPTTQMYLCQRCGGTENQCPNGYSCIPDITKPVNLLGTGSCIKK